MYKCPLCNGDKCVLKFSNNSYNCLINCKTYNIESFFEGSIKEAYNDNVNKELEISKIYNLIVEKILSEPYYVVSEGNCAWYFCFYNNELSVIEGNSFRINLAKSMVSYPDNFMDRMDRILINLSNKYKGFADSFDINDFSFLFRILFCDSNDINSLYTIFNNLLELKYISCPYPNSNHIYCIAPDGWKRLQELKSIGINQGFIAMRFFDETKEIDKAFVKAINSCGYNDMRIDRKEHNNQIVPELFYEIKRSRFMVVDVTYPNYGAYYEAGYAQSLGKEVIVCCRKDEFDKNSKEHVHFDIAQKNMIVWETVEELEKSLSKRIEATVGIVNK